MSKVIPRYPHPRLSWLVVGYIWLSSSYLRLSWTISCYLGVSMTILLYLGLFPAILGYLGYIWLSLTISGYLRISPAILAISGNIRQVISGYLGPSWATFAYHWLPMALCGSLRPFWAGLAVQILAWGGDMSPP